MMLLQVELVEQFFLALFNSFVTVIMELVNSAIGAVPGIVWALVWIGIGYLISIIVKKIIITFLEATTIDKWLEEQNLLVALGGKKVSEIIGIFIQWYIIAHFLAEGVSQLKLTTIQGFLLTIATAIPLVLTALVIFVVGLLAARYVRNAIESTRYKFKKTIGLAVEIIIVYVALVMALRHINIDVEIMLNLFNIAVGAFVLFAAIIAGIAFGLAFKNEAKRFVEDLKK